MRIKCISNFWKDLPDDLIFIPGGYAKDTKFDELSIGKEYVVYALTVLRGYFWYYIADEHYLYFPVYKPAVLFEITDPRLSKCWEIGFKFSQGEGTKNQIIAYKEWVHESHYYELLSDGNPREVKIYNQYKKLMDEEFN